MRIFVLFDIDGTLLFSNKVDSRCFASSYEQVFGKPFPTIDWTQFPEVTDHVIFRTAFHRHFGRYATDTERERFQDHYLNGLMESRARDPQQFAAVPGAQDLWNFLASDARFLTGIATGGWFAPAQIKLQHVGLPPGPPYAGYADGKFSRVDILQTAIDLAKNDYEVDKIVYVGDAIWDATTTSRMGIPMLGVRREGDYQVLHAAGVERVVSNFLPLESIVDTLLLLANPPQTRLQQPQ